MPYGIIKVDQVTFTNAGVDQTISVSGIVASISGNITATGTISGNVIRGGTTVSGATVTGTAGQFGTITGNTAGFTTVTGTTVTGVTATFTSGVFTNISGGTHTITSGVFALGSASNPSISFTSDPNTGIYSPGADQVAISTNGSGRLFVDASGRVGIGISPAANLHVNGTTGLRITGIPDKVTPGIYLPTGGILGDINDTFEIRNGGGASSELRLSTRGKLSVFTGGAGDLGGGTEKLTVTSAGLVGIGTSSPGALLDISGSGNIVRLGDGTNTFDVRFKGPNNWTTQLDTSADKFNIQRNSTSLVTVDGAGRLGIGTTPSQTFQVLSPTEVAGAFERTNADTRVYVYGGVATANLGSDYTGQIGWTGTSNNYPFAIKTSGSERLRVDTSGRLLVGTSSAPSGGDSQYSKFVVAGNTLGATAGIFSISRPEASSSITSGAALGYVLFTDGGAGEYARIAGFADANAGSNDYPGRLVFSTTADGASSLTERMRIDSSGRVGIGTTSPAFQLEVKDTVAATSTSSFAGFQATAGNTSFSYVNFGDSDDPNIGQISYLHSSDSLNFITNNATRTTIDSSGRLLVGTSSSVGGETVQFHNTTGNNLAVGRFVNSSGSPDIAFYKSRSGTIGTNTVVSNGDNLGVLSWRGADGTNYIESATISTWIDGTPGANDMPGRLVFSTTADGASSPTERMRIASGGDIGLFSDNDTLSSRTSVSAGTTRSTFIGAHSATTTQNGTISCRIYSNGNVQNTNGSYTTLSDAKLKENIVDAGSQWDDLKAIKIRKWNFKVETGHETHRQIGPIAQELEEICPGLVFETPDQDADGNDLGTTTKGVNQSVLYMKAVKALQEAMERIETLESEMAAVKAQLA